MTKHEEKMARRARCRRVRQAFAITMTESARKERWGRGRQALARILQRP